MTEKKRVVTVSPGQPYVRGSTRASLMGGVPKGSQGETVKRTLAATKTPEERNAVNNAYAEALAAEGRRKRKKREQRK